MGDFGQGPAVNGDGPGVGVQTCTLAQGALPSAEIFGEVLPHDGRLSVSVAPLHIWDYALEGVCSSVGVPLVVDIAELDQFSIITLQDSLPVLGRQFAKRCGHIKAKMFGDGTEHLVVIHIAPIPAMNSAFCQRQLFVKNHLADIKKLFDTNAITAWAGACRVIEGEQPWLQFSNGVAALRAGKPR